MNRLNINYLKEKIKSNVIYQYTLDGAYVINQNGELDKKANSS